MLEVLKGSMKFMKLRALFQNSVAGLLKGVAGLATFLGM